MDPVHWNEQNVNNVEIGIIHYRSTKTFQQFLIVNIILKKNSFDYKLSKTHVIKLQ